MILHQPWLTGTLVSVRCHARLCVHCPGLDVHHHRGVFLAILELAMHLAPGAPHAETGSGDVVAVGTLSTLKQAKGEGLIPIDLHRLDFWHCRIFFYHDAVSVAHADPCGQSRRRHTQGNSESGGDGRSAEVTQREASGLSHSCTDRAGQAGAAPEPVAAWRTKQGVKIKRDDYSLTQ